MNATATSISNIAKDPSWLYVAYGFRWMIAGSILVLLGWIDLILFSIFALTGLSKRTPESFLVFLGGFGLALIVLGSFASLVGRCFCWLTSKNTTRGLFIGSTIVAALGASMAGNNFLSSPVPAVSNSDQASRYGSSRNSNTQNSRSTTSEISRLSNGALGLVATVLTVIAIMTLGHQFQNQRLAKSAHVYLVYLLSLVAISILFLATLAGAAFSSSGGSNSFLLSPWGIVIFLLLIANSELWFMRLCLATLYEVMLHSGLLERQKPKEVLETATPS